MLPKPPIGARINQSHPLGRGLALAYLFNEGGSNKIFDGAWRRYDTTSNGPTWTPSGLSFDGVNDSVAVPNYIFGATGTFYILLKPTGITAGDAYQALFVSSAGNGFHIRSGSGKLDYYYGGDHLTTVGATEGQWNHMAAVSDAGAVSFYLNGAINGTAASATGFTAVTSGDDSFSETYAGEIACILVWNRALSQAEIQQLLADPYAAFRPADENVGFVAATGAITADLSATIANLTLSAAATHPVIADASPTIGNLTLSSAATHPVLADLSKTISNLTVSADATHPVIASLGATISNLTLTATASSGAVLDLSSTIAPITLSSSATHPVIGDSSATLGAITSTSTATHPVLADLGATIPAITLVSTLANGATVTADLGATIGPITLAVRVDIRGSILYDEITAAMRETEGSIDDVGSEISDALVELEGLL
jgi:hypothetical protein